MDTNQETLTPQQSLDIIRQMIEQAQGKVQKNSLYLILWGWVVAGCNFGVYALVRFTDFDYPYSLWLLVIPAWIITMLHSRKQDRQAGAQSHLDRINMWLWICAGIAIAPIVIFGYKINYNINPLTLNLVAVPTFLTGMIVRFRPLLFGGISLFVLGIVSFLVDPVTQHLVAGIAIITGYLVPGYLLKSLRERNHV